jgi:glycosyltransferase involved in cell wall biosynthesis
MSGENRIIILIPVYDDWKSLEILLQHLDAEFAGSDWEIELLVIDDGSQISLEEHGFSLTALRGISKVSVLGLRRNLGHQRAIALGLTYIEVNLKCKAVLIMDGDGEDTPPDARRLIEKCIAENFSKIIFARRTRRSEGLLFRLSYVFYRNFYRLLTGKQFRFGNFSVVPSVFLSRLSVISEGWNHYASSVLKAKIPYAEIDTARGVRHVGQSKMNFTSLIIHGLSSISVYAELVGVRMLIATFLLTAVSSVLIAIVVAVRFLTDLAIPGWATYVVGLLILILLQSVSLSLFFSFIVLGGRDTATFLPQRDYHYFIAYNYQLYPRSEK